MSVRDEAQEMSPELLVLRRDLHAHPEIGLDLPRTQETVLRALHGLGLEIAEGTRSTSVTAVLRAGAPRAGVDDPCPPVLLRADMDALPVQERTGLPESSRNDGVMHACGHDLHTTMLVGAAHLLAARRAQLACDVVLMFQPGEEGWEGARAMIEDGVLDAAGPRVGAAYGMHVFSTLERGFHTRPGPMLAASSALLVTVHGRGGHASAPHLARDPVPAAAEMVLALQAMVTRRFDPFDPVVLTVGVLHAGTRRNIIPAEVTFEATVRTFSAEATDRIGHATVTTVRGIAAAHEVEVDARFVPERPVTRNDPNETAFVDHTIGEVFGEDHRRTLEHPFTGAEDFSRVLAEVPGAFVAVGALPAGADPSQMAFNHSPHVVFDDSVLADGAALYTELALRHPGTGPAARTHMETPR